MKPSFVVFWCSLLALGDALWMSFRQQRKEQLTPLLHETKQDITEYWFFDKVQVREGDNPNAIRSALKELNGKFTVNQKEWLKANVARILEISPAKITEMHARAIESADFVLYSHEVSKYAHGREPEDVRMPYGAEVVQFQGQRLIYR